MDTNPDLGSISSDEMEALLQQGKGSAPWNFEEELAERLPQKTMMTNSISHSSTLSKSHQLRSLLQAHIGPDAVHLYEETLQEEFEAQREKMEMMNRRLACLQPSANAPNAANHDLVTANCTFLYGNPQMAGKGITIYGGKNSRPEMTAAAASSLTAVFPTPSCIGSFDQDAKNHSLSSGGWSPSSPSCTTATAPRNYPCVKMRGLPFSASVSDVVLFFQGFNLIPHSIRFGSTLNGRPSGEGWVLFSDYTEAVKAIQAKNHKNIGNRYIELFMQESTTLPAANISPSSLSRTTLNFDRQPLEQGVESLFQHDIFEKTKFRAAAADHDRHDVTVATINPLLSPVLPLSLQEDSCFHCGKEGHLMKNCPNIRYRDSCFQCGMPGHRAKDCTQGDGMGQICREFLSGKCHRNKCKFRHVTGN